jgi:transcription antitermination protein NusB
VRRTEQRRAATVALYQADVTDRRLSDLLPRDATEFTKQLAEGVQREQEQLDGLIERYAEGWTLDRIAPLERNILRVSLFELLHRVDVPAEVAIDEAVETAKELCGADAPGFINGILGSVQRNEATDEATDA